MARLVRDANLESRTARSRLAPRGKPYYRDIEEGLHLGYRKPTSGVGKWVVRHYNGEGGYETKTIAAADDFSDADGIAILSYAQAQMLARSQMVQRAHASTVTSAPMTVGDAIEEYLSWLDTNRKSAGDARARAKAFIIPELGHIELAKLTYEDLHSWHVELTQQAPRARTRPGQPQKYRAMEDSEDYRRKRRSSANRVLTILKGSLNRAWKAGHISSDNAWRRVEPFEGVDAARLQYLSIDEAKRLIAGCPQGFRPMIEAALQTGARYGELTRMNVSDFNADAGSVAVRQSKSGKARHIILTPEGVAFFKALSLGRETSDALLVKPNGERWGPSHQNRPMEMACKNAKIVPAISFHILRHTWASHSVMNGVPLMVVAKNLGHTDTRMVEKHYGHLADSYISDAIRSNAPRFGTQL